MLVKHKKWGEAVEMQMRFGAAADKTGSLNAQRKAYLGMVSVVIRQSSGFV